MFHVKHRDFAFAHAEKGVKNVSCETTADKIADFGMFHVKHRVQKIIQNARKMAARGRHFEIR